MMAAFLSDKIMTSIHVPQRTAREEAMSEVEVVQTTDEPR